MWDYVPLCWEFRKSYVLVSTRRALSAVPPLKSGADYLFKPNYQCWDLQCIVGRIQSITLWRPYVMRVRGAKEELCKRIQHCCATLRRPRNKRNVGSCWLKNLTGFKLCATTPNNTQQHATTCSNRVCKRTQHVTSNNVGSCWANKVASDCMGLKSFVKLIPGVCIKN